MPGLFQVKTIPPCRCTVVHPSTPCCITVWHKSRYWCTVVYHSQSLFTGRLPPMVVHVSTFGRWPWACMAACVPWGLCPIGYVLDVGQLSKHATLARYFIFTLLLLYNNPFCQVPSSSCQVVPHRPRRFPIPLYRLLKNRYALIIYRYAFINNRLPVFQHSVTRSPSPRF